MNTAKLEGVSLRQLRIDLEAGNFSEEEVLLAIELKLTRKNMRDLSRKRWTQMRDILAESISKNSDFNKLKPKDNLLKEAQPLKDKAQPYKIDGVSLRELHFDLEAGKVSEQDALMAVELKLKRKNMRDLSRRRWSHERDRLSESIAGNTNNNEGKSKPNLLKLAYSKTKKRTR